MENIDLRESKLTENNVLPGCQSVKDASKLIKKFERENMQKSVTKLPSLKKKNEEIEETKGPEVIEPPSFQKRVTDPGQKKTSNNAQSNFHSKKFNSKQRNSKKKEMVLEFKPEQMTKHEQYLNFLECVNLSNNLKVTNQKHEKLYTLEVGKGNNSALIKNLFKAYRPWWNVKEKDCENSDINLHWSQLRQSDILDDFKTVQLPEDKCDYFVIEAESLEQKVEKSKSSSISIKREGSAIRSLSLIQKDSTALSKTSTQLTITVSTKRNSSKQRINNKSNDRNSRLSPMANKQSLKEIKEEAIDIQMHSTKKNLANPKMWPIYYMYRKLFSSLDMKAIKKLQVIGEDGKIHGKISRSRNRTILNRSRHITMHNHLENNWNLSNKKALFMNLKNYYEARKMNPFDYIPMTFHIQCIGDKEYDNFVEEYHRRTEHFAQEEKNAKKQQYKNATFKPKKRNAWLIKPGENSNRGIGIEVVESLEDMKEMITHNQFDHLGRPRTHIVQEYILPFLYQKRKFDIRCYILVTSVNGYQKGYWYQDGYIRTASKEFNMKNLANKMIHLTNDFVQKKGEDYGRYENGNKLSFTDFQRYLDSCCNTNENGQKIKFWQQAYPEMKKTAADAIRSVYTKINPSKKEFSFEIFGLDFLIDENFKIWLIEANTNPCLELSSPLLSRLIPNMLDNALKIAVDPLFPPPPITDILNLCRKVLIPENCFQNNKFELVFDEAQEGSELRDLLNTVPEVKIYDIEEEEQEYEDEHKNENNKQQCKWEKQEEQNS